VKKVIDNEKIKKTAAKNNLFMIPPVLFTKECRLRLTVEKHHSKNEQVCLITSAKRNIPQTSLL
jgi:hypothetical protein